MSRVRLIAPVLVLVLLAGAAPVDAAERPPLGPRLGYTHWDGLDQFHLGGHVFVGDLFPNVALRPGLELGFGDGATLWSVNGDLVYRATEFAQELWEPYVGGSVAVIHANTDFGDDTDLGLSLVAGTTYQLADGNGLLGELRIGLIDSPDIKLTCGYTFF